MKRFRFQLEPVLDFKLQNLDALLVEMNAIQARVVAQERVLEDAQHAIVDFDTECQRKREEGMTILEAIESGNCRRVLEQREKREQEKLKQLRMEAEQKREEVVEARKETHSLEKLKSIRRSEYDKALAKAEEKNLDDLTAARRFPAAESA